MRLNWRAWAHFLGMVLLVGGGSAWLGGHWLAKPWLPGSLGSAAAWALATLLWAFPILRLTLFRERGSSLLQRLAFVGIGLAATFTFFLIVLSLAGLGLRLAGLSLPPWSGWAVLAFSAALMALGWRSAFQAAELRVHALDLPGLHPGLQGLRIAQISDLHVSHFYGEAQVRALVERVQALKPDLIAVTGDLVDGPPDEALRRALSPLAGLSAPLGVHYVTGNHEYYWGVERWLGEIAGLGLEILDNTHRSLEHRGARVLVAGLPDPTARLLAPSAAPDPAKALAGAPQRDFLIYLAHQPAALEHAQAAGAQLFLAGHTHGGQFFPFSLLIGLFHRHPRGLHRIGQDLWAYVHTGSGFWGPPSRLGVAPEIALFELGRGAA